MLRNAAVFTLFCFLSGFPCAWGFEGSQGDRYFSGHRSPDDQALIHGYYPKEFSENFPDYWVTSEEAGHYILGHAQQSERYYSTYTEPVAISPGDPTRVLISGARTYIIEETIDPQIVSANNRPTRINDSLDLPKIIEKHKWIIPSFAGPAR